MHDFVGVVRPLAEAMQLAQPLRPRVPPLEVLAWRAVAELAALGPASPRMPLGSPRLDIGMARRDAVDGGREGVLPAGLAPDLVIRPASSPTRTSKRWSMLVRGYGAWRAFRLLREAGCPMALAVLLSRATEKLLAGRLEHMAQHEMSAAELTAQPVAYWTNLSVRSVFHASERRARGLPTVGMLTILANGQRRYRCDVFDALATVGTGQVLDGVRAFRAGPPQRHSPPMHEPTRGHALVALQPAGDIVAGLAGFSRLALRAGWRLSVRPHPVQRRDPTVTQLWSRDVPASDFTWFDGELRPGELVVTGTSNIAIEACLRGCPVVLVCDHEAAAELWAGSPPPGHVLPPSDWRGVGVAGARAMLDETVVAATAASERFAEHYHALPPFA